MQVSEGRDTGFIGTDGFRLDRNEFVCVFFRVLGFESTIKCNNLIFCQIIKLRDGYASRNVVNFFIIDFFEVSDGWWSFG